MPLTNLIKKNPEIRLIKNNERKLFEVKTNFRDRSPINSIR